MAYRIDDDENRIQDLEEKIDELEVQTFSPEVVARNESTRNTGIQTGDGAVTNPYPQWIPIRDFGSLGNLTLDILLNRTDSHVAKLTATGDIDFAFSLPPPVLKMMWFILDVTVDGTGGYTFNLPGNVTPATTIDNTANARTVIRLTTTDGGVTYYAENLTTGGSGESQTPWLSDIDANTFDLFNLDSLQFMSSAGSLLAAAVGITPIDDKGLRIQVAQNGIFRVTEDDASTIPFEIDTSTNIATFNDTSLRILDTTNNDFLQIISTDALISFNSNANDMLFAIGASNILRIESDGIAIQDSKNITGIGTLGMAQLGQGIESPSTAEMRLVTNSILSIFTNTHSFEFAQFGAENILTTPIPFLAIEDGEIILSSISEPPDTASITIGKIFMDSGNSNHLSIKRLTSVFDLEAVGSQTPWTSDINANTFDLFNLDKLTFMNFASTGSSLNIGLSAIGNGGFRANVLDSTGKFQITNENTVHFEFDAGSDTSTFIDTLVSVTETVGSTAFSIAKFNGSTQLSDPTKIDFQIAGTTGVSLVDNGLIFTNNRFIAGLSQLGFSINGNIIQNDANGMIFDTPPGDEFTWRDGTTEFAILDIDGLFLNDMFIQIDSITSPTTSGLDIGKIFMDSGNSNHLSIVRDTIVVDLEGGGGSSATAIAMPLSAISARGLATAEVNGIQRLFVSEGQSNGSIQRITTDGAILEEIVSSTDSGTNKFLTSDGLKLFLFSSGTPQLRSYNLDGTGQTTLIFGIADISNAQDITTDGSNLFMASGPLQERIVKTNMTGGSLTNIITNLDTVVSCSVNSTHLFVCDIVGGNPTIYRFDKNGGGQTTILNSGLSNVSKIFVTDSFIYISDTTDDRVVRTDLAGANLVVILENTVLSTSPRSLLTFGTDLFVCDLNFDHLVKVPLP